MNGFTEEAQRVASEDVQAIFGAIEKLPGWQRVKLASELMRQALDGNLPRQKTLSVLAVAENILRAELTTLGALLALAKQAPR